MLNAIRSGKAPTRRVWLLFALVILPVLLSPQVWGQTGVGIVRGTVHRESESGPPVAGVWLIIRNVDLGMAYRKDTGDGGRFEFLDVYPGTYVFAISPGTLVIRSPQQIQVRAEQVLDVTVVVGPASRNSGPIQTNSAEGLPSSSAASAGAQISESQLVGLPLNGRSYNQLATLQSAVSDPLGGNASRGGGSGSLTVSGGRSSSNTFLMDGTTIMDTNNQVPRSAGGVQLGSDTVLEVQVYGTQYGAEYGRGSGGVLNSITRSGTEEWRATLFEFFRNSKLDARNFFDRGPDPPPFKRNQFGATVTGPLQKQRTYFMGGLEVMRDRLTATDSSSVIDPQRAPLLVPEVDPRVQQYLALFLPANAGTRGLGYGRNSTPVFQPTDETFFAVRADHRISDRDSFFVRYNFDDATTYITQSLAQFRTQSESRAQYLTLVGSHIFSPRAITTMRLGYTRPAAARTSVSSVEVPRALFFVPSAPQFGQIQVPGASSFGPSPNLPTADTMNSFQFAGDVLLQRGSHSLKIGAEAHRYRWDTYATANQGGVWSFNSLESFLLAGPEATTELTVALPGSEGSRAYRQTLVGLYLQDEYRAHPRLLLSLGLRYEFATLIHDREGRTAFLADPLRDSQMHVGPFLKNNPSFRNVSPRLGLTWSPFGNPATIFSSGFGIYYDQILEYVVDSRGLSPPFYKSVFISNMRAYDFFPDALAAASAATAEGKSSSTQALILDYHNLTTPRVLRYNASLRQQLPGNWRVQASYVGARGNHLYRAYEINQYPVPIRREDGSLYFSPSHAGLNPAFGSINLLSSDGQSFYNALQFSATKTFGRGNSVQGNYTYSKSIDDSSVFNVNSDSIQYGLMRTLDRALSDYDIRNRLTLSYFYTVPLGSQGLWWKTGPLGRLFGGWRLGGILSARSGTPINLRINVRNEGYLFAANRPNLLPGRDGSAHSGVTSGCEGVPAGIPLGTPDLWYDPCSFSVPAAGTLGNNGRNTLPGPGSFTVDVSLQREFLLDSRRRIQFRAEAFNLTNHPNFRPFVANSGIVFTGTAANSRRNPTQGQFVNPSTTSRQIQFALRLSF